METKFLFDDRVLVIPIHETGTITTVRTGEKVGGILYTVRLDNSDATFDGHYLAREFELAEIFTLQRAKSLDGDASEYQD